MTDTHREAPVLADENVVPAFELHHRLGRALEIRRLSVGAMAEAFGVSSNTISRWINGHTKPRKADVYMWSVLTGVNLEWLETGQAPDQGPTPDVPLPRLDSNQQPSGYRFRPVIVKGGLTADRQNRDAWELAA